MSGCGDCRAASGAGWTWRSRCAATRSCCSSMSPRRASTRRPGARPGTWSSGSTGSGRTVLLTTHFMDEAQVLADRLAVMVDGRIVPRGRRRGRRSRARPPTRIRVATARRGAAMPGCAGDGRRRHARWRGRAAHRRADRARARADGLGHRRRLRVRGPVGHPADARGRLPGARRAGRPRRRRKRRPSAVGRRQSPRRRR